MPKNRQNMPIRKAIIPVAGFGTRFLPATKAQPKEMLTLVDKPVIQYIVEEAVAAGITDIILITGQNKRAIEDHFDRNFELEYILKQKGKKELLKQVEYISSLANFYYVRQKTPLGDGHAILQAKNLIDPDEPVVILYGDDIVVSKKPIISEMIAVYNKFGKTVVAVDRVPQKDTSQYGVVDIVKSQGQIHEIKNFVEKPDPAVAPSNLAWIGKSVVTPEVMRALAKVKPSKNGEIRLADAFHEVLKKDTFYAYELDGKRFDCGSKLGFLKATIYFGLQHQELKNDFAKYLKSIKI